MPYRFRPAWRRATGTSPWETLGDGSRELLLDEVKLLPTPPSPHSSLLWFFTLSLPVAVNRPYKWFVQLLPLDVLACFTLACFTLRPGPLSEPPLRSGVFEASVQAPKMAWGFDFSPLPANPEMDTGRFVEFLLSANAPSQPACPPSQSPRLCRNSGTASAGAKRWCHHRVHE